MRRALCLLGLCLPLLSFGQKPSTYPVFETDKLPNALYKTRRQAIKDQLGAGGVAIVFTNPERNRSNDTDFRFRPSSNFWYLTGFEEPNSALILAPSGFEWEGKRVTELLLVNESNAMSETWLGYRMGTANVPSLLGIEAATANRRLPEVLEALSKTSNLSVARPIVPPDPGRSLSSLIDKVTEWRKDLTTNNLRLEPALAKMRVVKSPEEQVLMRKAAEISALGHIEAMRSIEPGMREYEIQAVVEYVFTRFGCESVAYNSIVGSGPNSCILHYEADRRLMKAGELVCMDVAGEYHGYAADITRTFPVSGKFSTEQRQVYEVVLAAQEAGIAACKVGANFGAAHEAATKVLLDGLTRLGIIHGPKELGLYFMHGTSHYLGLDVHDAHGDDVLRDGAVLTVEPGIYIKEGSPCDPKWWNIGVRIEDDILVTNAGPVNLSAHAPKKVADIEALMRQRGIGKQPIPGVKKS